MNLRVRKKTYLIVTLSKNGQHFTKTVHRLVALTFIENPCNKPFVNHRDGNKLNNNDWNLEWSTAKENTAHSIINGLQERGVTSKKRYSCRIIDTNTMIEYGSIKEVAILLGISSNTLIYQLSNNSKSGGSFIRIDPPRNKAV